MKLCFVLNENKKRKIYCTINQNYLQIHNGNFSIKCYIQTRYCKNLRYQTYNDPPLQSHNKQKPKYIKKLSTNFVN